MLYIPQAAILDFTGAHIKTKEDIEAAFHALNLCSHEDQKSDGKKSVKVSSYQIVILLMITKINPRLKTSAEERQYNTIPGSAIATHIVLSN